MNDLNEQLEEALRKRVKFMKIMLWGLFIISLPLSLFIIGIPLLIISIIGLIALHFYSKKALNKDNISQMTDKYTGMMADFQDKVSDKRKE